MEHRDQLSATRSESSQSSSSDADAYRTLVLDGKTTKGVTFRWRGRSYRAFCTAEVVLAAGAINSPKILELSGIGQPNRLSDLGVTPTHDCPGVGENLQDHLQIRTVFKVQDAKNP
ncbi:GMC family oxidoreductase N-terminal domain-containing protein [Aliiroseovarius sp. Z3]|uniref:GMC family oxidoreductase N-terminal domain-containing protein n=1 Tax=Aliiroseovarius sp. Z3 TaxID=2811402 RepID=UPI0023B29677|nr:GMC family oxidoreductase N-terminal domain-containing protein [Aliiroseovarius sp. Z3]